MRAKNVSWTKRATPRAPLSFAILLRLEEIVILGPPGMSAKLTRSAGEVCVGGTVNAGLMVYVRDRVTSVATCRSGGITGCAFHLAIRFCSRARKAKHAFPLSLAFRLRLSI